MVPITNNLLAFTIITIIIMCRSLRRAQKLSRVEQSFQLEFGDSQDGLFVLHNREKDLMCPKEALMLCHFKKRQFAPVIPKWDGEAGGLQLAQGQTGFYVSSSQMGLHSETCLKNWFPPATPETRHCPHQGFWSQLSFLDQVGKFIIIKRRGPRRVLGARMNQL